MSPRAFNFSGNCRVRLRSVFSGPTGGGSGHAIHALPAHDARTGCPGGPQGRGQRFLKRKPLQQSIAFSIRPSPRISNLRRWPVPFSYSVVLRFKGRSSLWDLHHHSFHAVAYPPGQLCHLFHCLGRKAAGSTSKIGKCRVRMSTS